MKILVVDDEDIIRETLEAKFRREGFAVETAASAEDALIAFKRSKPDLIVLDIMLPQRSGYDFCIAIRRESTVPIIFLSAKAAETNRIQGLELGADDFVTKPFHLNELAARVKAVLRRSHQEATQEAIEKGDLRINPTSHEAFRGNQPLELSPKEFALLNFLLRNVGIVFTRETLLDRVWGSDADVSARTVDVHVRWLRSQIEVNPEKPQRILTVRGVGYKFAG